MLSSDGREMLVAAARDGAAPRALEVIDDEALGHLSGRWAACVTLLAAAGREPRSGAARLADALVAQMQRMHALSA
jgi:hypothetical protein